jgi:hypothetical protein
MKINPIFGIIIFIAFCFIGSYLMEIEVAKRKENEKGKITLDSLSSLDTLKKNKNLKTTAK